MYFLQDLINKSYNLWGGGCRKYTPPTYHTANSIPQHAKRENRKILNGGTAQNVENFTPAAYYDKNEAKGEGGRRGQSVPAECLPVSRSKISDKARHPGRCKHRPLQIALGSYRKYMSLRERTLLSKIVLRAMFVITESFLAG